MIANLTIFAASFSSVFLGCFQAVNVVRGRHLWALVTSIGQSTALLGLYRTVPVVHGEEAAIAFIVGGVLGGQLSMLLTRSTRS